MTTAAASAGPPKKPSIFPLASISSFVDSTVTFRYSWGLLSSVPPVLLSITLTLILLITSIHSTGLDFVENYLTGFIGRFIGPHNVVVDSCLDIYCSTDLCIIYGWIDITT